jgi:hypothetical protein
VEPGSPFGGESRPGQVPLHRANAPIKFGSGGFTRLSQVILEEDLDGSMPAHTKESEGNHPVETQIRSLRISCPLDEALVHQLLATHCVISSLTLVSLGGSELWQTPR